MKTKKLLNCKFTDEEMRQFGITLAQEAQRKERLEDAKKQSASQFKADIDAVDAQIRSLSQKLARGSEDRYVDCDVFFNSPEEGKKTIVRTDTGETLSVSPMTEDEQLDLFINELQHFGRTKTMIVFSTSVEHRDSFIDVPEEE